MLLVKPASAGCDELPERPSVWAEKVPDAIRSYFPDDWDTADRGAAIADCKVRWAKAEERWREIKGLRDYPEKGAHMESVIHLQRALSTGNKADINRYERALEEDATRRRNMGWEVPAPASLPSSYYPPGGDPHGVRLGVAPKGTAKDLSDVKSRVLELKSPGH